MLRQPLTAEMSQHGTCRDQIVRIAFKIVFFHLGKKMQRGGTVRNIGYLLVRVNVAANPERNRSGVID